ncbi:MAG: transglutaminase-like domain-containing protein [Thermoanaerobaculia bacterium]|nr:transglutaminase-like domain-containing protein [Thermoanaerobaculia bacterium]
MGSFGWMDRLRHLARRHPFLYRLRYALILRLDDYPFLDPPVTGRAPDESAPADFLDIVERLGPFDGSFEDAKRLAFDLSRDHPRGPGLGISSVGALRAVYRAKHHGGAGVCSDYTQIFLGLCRAAGIPCREWGLTSTLARRGIGHALTEVFVEDLGSWVLLDPYLSVFATTEGGETPLSMIEAIDLTTAGRRDSIEMRAIDDLAVPPDRRDGYVARYFEPGHLFFVLSNNDVFRQDRYLQRFGFLPLPARHLIMLVAGVYQRFHIYANEQNRRFLTAEVARSRRFLVGLASTGLLLVTGIAVLVGWVVSGSGLRN